MEDHARVCHKHDSLVVHFVFLCVRAPDWNALFLKARRSRTGCWVRCVNRWMLFRTLHITDCVSLYRLMLPFISIVQKLFGDGMSPCFLCRPGECYSVGFLWFARAMQAWFTTLRATFHNILLFETISEI